MVAKPNTVPDPDEDIIELTDIIAQGSPPVPGASVPHTDDHLHDLLHEGSHKEEDNDLDALLAELGAHPQATPEDLLDRTMQNAVNPDETLDMPNMREVEHLLDELDIPAQAPVSVDAAAAEHDAGEGLDAIIEQLGAAPSAAPAAPDPVDDLDALLDSVAAAPVASAPPTTPTTAPVARLEDVAASVPVAAPAAQTTRPSITVRVSTTSPAPAAKPVAPETPEAPAVEAMDELDALLESTAAAKPDSPKISVSPSLTDDLDAFLESMPPTPPRDDVDATLPPMPERAAPSHAGQTPAFVRPARDVLADGEAPLLPRQWDSLLGHEPETRPAAQAPQDTPGVVPPEILERLAHMETRLAAVHADGADVSALETFERRMQALESRADAVPPVNVDNAMHELNAAMGKTEQRVSVLEETLRAITTSQSESADPDNPALQALQTLVQGMEERFARLENRLDKLESGSKEELERAAAAAAARILREELSAILAEEAE